ncbi:MAG: carotenoid 1,2-hydratase [Nitrospirales bacterium]|nr:MAG: carotenoid 1,2-hydratase [Nitrospirales bacterium]
MADERPTPTFQQAQKGYTYTFPDDHGAHENFLIEWWYFTGHVFTSDNRRFGYELTFFRRAIDDARAWTNPSQWAIRQLYLAHFALTNEKHERFQFAEKVSRAALGKAGATQGALHTWLDQWSVQAVDQDHQRFRLQAETDNFSIDFVTHAEKSPVIHGLEGISRKGTNSTHASHYYSFTRLHTTGTLRIHGEDFPVTGTSWMDHEFSSSDLEDGLVGWDWFSLQLDSGHDIMTYWLRQHDGTFSPASSGTLIFPDGSSQHLTREDLTISILDHWESPMSGARYPNQWTLTISSHNLQLHITPRMHDQELRTDRSTQVTYWEGAVDASGTFGQKPVTGMGYVELTGYDQPS